MKAIITQAPEEAVLHSTNSITIWLARLHSFWFTIYASLCAFSLYTCVYAFRKTFAAATFADISFAGLDYKVWLVIAQVCGYALSKFAGIKMIAKLKSASRATGILIISAVAWLSWLAFALLPMPFNVVCLFINGLVLGMGWGMVFGYLEGRRMTEVLGAALSISFIFSSGLCRSAGAYIMLHWHISETWMPFVASCVFTVPLFLCLFFLDKIPPPTDEDERLRTRRQPMNAAERKKFVVTFLPGIVLFVLAYMLLTAFRDFRDNFSAEVWRDLGYSNSSGIYTKTEIPVSITVMIVMGAIMLIRNNVMALMVNHAIIIAGLMLIGISTLLFQSGLVDPSSWMIMTGLGLYLGYVPFNSIFFDRMIATFQYAGTVGFIMYVADAFGYLGSIAVLFLKQFSNNQESWLNFTIRTGYLISALGTALITASMIYFYWKHKHWQTTAIETNTNPDS